MPPKRGLIATGTVVAFLAGFAGVDTAFAQQKPISFTAQTTAPAKRQGVVQVPAGVWTCQGASCFRTGPENLLNVDACKALAREVGAIRFFGHPGKGLSLAELTKCNEGQVASTAAPAPPAPQKPISFTAQTTAPAKRQGVVQVPAGAWTCQGTSCSRTGPENLLSVDACKTLAKEVGAIHSFGYPGKGLSAAELAKCNEGQVASTAPPAPSAPAPPAPGTPSTPSAPPAPGGAAGAERPFSPISVRTASIQYTGGPPATTIFKPLSVTTSALRYQGGTATASPPFAPITLRTDTISYTGRVGP
jgi:hypothetical protein